MGILDMILVGIVAGWLVAVLRFMRKRKKNGGSVGCSGNCVGCRGCTKYEL